MLANFPALSNKACLDLFISASWYRPVGEIQGSNEEDFQSLNLAPGKLDGMTGAAAPVLACEEKWGVMSEYCINDAKLHAALYQRATSNDGVIHSRYARGETSVSVINKLVEDVATRIEQYRVALGGSAQVGDAAQVGEKRKADDFPKMWEDDEGQLWLKQDPADKWRRVM